MRVPLAFGTSAALTEQSLTSWRHGVVPASVWSQPFLQGPLVPFSRGWHLETRIWVFEFSSCTGVSLLLGPFSSQNMGTHTHARTRTHTHTDTRTHAHTHTHRHAHTHTHTHTQLYPLLQLPVHVYHKTVCSDSNLRLWMSLFRCFSLSSDSEKSGFPYPQYSS